MPNYTKGEWEAGSHNDEPLARSEMVIYGEDDQRVAEVCRTGFTPYEEAQANAHLIAAAPDMYQKLIKIKKWLTMLLEDAQQHLKTERNFITLVDAWEHDIKNYKATIADIDLALAKADKGYKNNGK